MIQLSIERKSIWLGQECDPSVLLIGHALIHVDNNTRVASYLGVKEQRFKHLITQLIAFIKYFERLFAYLKKNEIVYQFHQPFLATMFFHILYVNRNDFNLIYYKFFNNLRLSDCLLTHLKMC